MPVDEQMAMEEDPVLAYVFSTCIEQPAAVKTSMSGTVPAWLNGTLLGIGPAQFEVGEHNYNHYSDGLALLTRFTIKKGRVSFRSRYLRGETYNKNQEEKRIVFDEGGTLASPDPTKNSLGRFASKLTTKKLPSDNCNVNIWLCEDGECFAVGEKKFVLNIDPHSLETNFKMDLSEQIPDVLLVTGHLQKDKDKSQYGLATTISAGVKYSLFKIPPKVSTGGRQDGMLNTIEVMKTFPGQFKASPCFVHTIGITEKYVVILENPFYVDILKLLKQKILSDPTLEAFSFDNEIQSRIHVLRKDTGDMLVTRYFTTPMATIHQINCYEEGQNIIVDAFVLKDPLKVLKGAYLDSLRSFGGYDLAEAQRFVVPLQTPFAHEVLQEATGAENEKPIKESFSFKKKEKVMVVNPVNLVDLKGCSAQCNFQQDGSVFCTPVTLCKPGFEKPCVNPDVNGRRYQYFYAVGGYSNESQQKGCICKVDVNSQQQTLWRAEANHYPQEALFVPSPNSSAEDDGILLSSVIVGIDDQPDYMLILDATSMKEIARAVLPVGVRVPPLNHEIYIPKAETE